MPAFERFEQTGIPGRSDHVSRFRLAEVLDLLAGGRTIYENGTLGGAITHDIADFAQEAGLWEDRAELEVKFITPVSVVNSHARERDPESGITIFTDFYDLIYNLTNRVGGLWQLYGDGWPGQAGFFRWRDQLLEASRQITTTQRGLQMVRTWVIQTANMPIARWAGSRAA